MKTRTGEWEVATYSACLAVPLQRALVIMGVMAAVVYTAMRVYENGRFEKVYGYTSSIGTGALVALGFLLVIAVIAPLVIAEARRSHSPDRAV